MGEICEKRGLPYTGIIDFYDYDLNSQISQVELRIAQSVNEQLEDDPFADYWKIRQAAEKAHQSRDATYSLLREKSKDQFIVDLKKWAEETANTGKRGVIIFDTFETVQNNHVGARILNEWLPALKSAVVVLSGRQGEGDLEFPTSIAHLVTDTPLSDFTLEEASDYLNERGVLEAIKEDGVTEKLFTLTERRPLLLALSADWIRENPDYKGPKTLVEGASPEDFEQKLVERLPRLTGPPENEILPYMAHVPRLFNLELIQFLVPDLSEDLAATILKNLSRLSFIKELELDGKRYYWYQDELRRLFHQYVFKKNVRGHPRRLAPHQASARLAHLTAWSGCGHA